MPTESPTPPPVTEPMDDANATTGYTPAAGAPVPPADPSEATADFPQSSPLSEPTAEVVPSRPPTQGLQHEGTSPDGETGAYTPGGTLRPAPHPSGAAPPVRADRYTLVRFHARGGMGEVWLAEDCDVGRPVALKRMRRKGTPEEQERFLREARVTGQLEHPGIVPVHELGSDEEGRPIYVMKFVHGRTLTEAVKEYHRREPAAEVPREVQLLRLLEVFVSLCQTVAYAHSRGVLHRDLKPDNVMLGPYGETMVLDWGLAKVVGQAEGAEGGISAALTVSGESMESVAGSVRGTPGYMAPEMAGGQVDAIDQLSDVYLLGATLYHILAGRPARRGKSMPELLREAQTVPPPPPRSIDPTVPRPLEAICLKAMAFAKADRYAGAAALAEDVQRYLAGEPVTAYRESWLDRLGRWVRKHRRALTRAAVAAVVVGVVVTAFLVVRKALADRAEAKLQAAQSAEALRLQNEARDRLADFNRKADESRFYLASLTPATRQTPYYDPKKGEGVGRDALAAAGRLADPALPLTDGQRDDVAGQQYDLLLLLAQARAHEGTEAGAREGLDWLARAQALRPASASLHRLRAECYHQLNDGRADDERRAADVEVAAPAAIDFFLRGEEDRAAALRPVATAADLEGGKPDQELLRKALAEFAEALRLRPNDFWSHYHVGLCLMSLGRPEEAVEAFGACLALRPESVWAFTARASALFAAGRYDDAELDLTRALERDPELMAARLTRGVIAMLQDKPEKGRQAMDDFTAVLSAPPDRRLIEAAYYRGGLYKRLERPDEAQADFDRVAAENPRDRRVFRWLAAIHFLHNDEAKGLDDLTAFLTAGRPLDPNSAAAYEGRGRLLSQLAAEVPEKRAEILKLAVEQFRKAGDLGAASAEFFHTYGRALANAGDLPGALAKLGEAVNRKPDDVNLLYDRGETRVLTGDARQVLLADDDFRDVLKRDPKHAAAHSLRAYVLAEKKDAPAALREAHLATLYGPSDYGVLHNVATAYGALSNGDAKRRTEYEDLAIDTLRRAVEWWRKLGKQKPGELFNLENEGPAFSAHLRDRPEFQAVVEEAKKP